MYSFLLKLVSEFLGTFLLMLSVLVSGGNAVVIGATLGLVVFLTGGISGAIVNPALAIGLLSANQFPYRNIIGYILVQILGALAAVYAFKYAS
jgi:glycerol uptake facilitator-like aquaporin